MCPVGAPSGEVVTAKVVGEEAQLSSMTDGVSVGVMIDPHDGGSVGVEAFEVPDPMYPFGVPRPDPLVEPSAVDTLDEL